MRVAEPVQSSWKARLCLGFENREGKTVLSRREHDGPLVVQKALYPEGDAVCHAIVVHPPGGIAGGDELSLNSKIQENAQVLMTAPGAAKWYRSAGPWARQRLLFDVQGTLEWLPRESIVFDAARASLECDVEMGDEGRYIGWEVVCLGRTGSGERFGRGELRSRTALKRGGRLLWREQGSIDGGGRIMSSPAGLGGRSVFGTFLCAAAGEFPSVKGEISPTLAVTKLPGVLVARYLGDSSGEAMAQFIRLWKVLRPALIGRDAIEPRIWGT